MVKAISGLKVVVFKFILLFIATSFYAQQKGGIKGIVFLADVPLANVNVKNLSFEDVVATDEKGQFTINASLGDTLLFSSIQLDDLRLILSQKDIKTANIAVRMKEKTVFLKEVLIDNYSGINAVSLGIIPKKIKELTPAERRLKTAGDFKFIDLLSLLGGSLEIDPILNAINGRTKRLKKEIEIEKKESNLSFLKNNFYSYLNKDVKLSDSSIQRIFYYAVDDAKITMLIKSRDNEKIKFFLLDYVNTLETEQ